MNARYQACLAVLLVAAMANCSYVSAPTRPLSGNPPRPGPIYVSTSYPDAPYETVAFLQVERVGVTAGGYADLGGIGLDTATFYYLLGEARRFRSNGVVIVDFRDVDPPTDAERAADMLNTASSGEVETRNRKILFHAEIIRIGRSR